MRVRRYMVRKSMCVKRMAAVDHCFAYLENISSIGEQPHADLSGYIKWVEDMLCLRDKLLEKREVRWYTYEGVLKLHNANGCEILVVDAEGSDYAIIDSMITACEEGYSSWPTIVVYES